MGRTIHSAERNLALKVIQFFENEKQNRCLSFPLEQATKRACAATGISKTTIMKIKSEARKLQTLAVTKVGVKRRMETATEANVKEEIMSDDEDLSKSTPVTTIKLPTPGKKRKKYRKKTDLDNLQLCAMRSLIESFYITRKEIPTLKRILKIAKEELCYPGQRDAIRQLINKLGFKFKKSKGKRDYLVQRPELAAWRAKYLRRLKENDERGADKKLVTFIDETCVQSNPNGTACQTWIVIHAGNENGFIQGAEHFHKCKSTTSDYENEIDAPIFTKWIKEKLIPNLPTNGIIVMDDAPCHSKQANKAPKYSASKIEMQTWLEKHNIEFDDKMTKRELFMLTKRCKPEKVYVIDEILKTHGHEVLRLPPNHYDLNPLEYIWNLMLQNLDQSENDIERLIKEAIQRITTEDWKKECEKVDQLRDKFWHADRLYEREERELIASLGGEESDSDTDDNILSDSDEVDDNSDAMSG